jgi:hypothetical protein
MTRYSYAEMRSMATWSPGCGSCCFEEFVPVPQPEDLLVGPDAGVCRPGESFEVPLEWPAQLALLAGGSDRILGEEAGVPRQVDVVVVQVALGECDYGASGVGLGLPQCRIDSAPYPGDALSSSAR